mmetsp:Transcript_11018/g.34957  ORF Transcript_11018/g.34957 Transcript_11018/m.34957 type:complete len:312 (+) Transcript_11018:1282-2217(+)
MENSASSKGARRGKNREMTAKPWSAQFQSLSRNTEYSLARTSKSAIGAVGCGSNRVKFASSASVARSTDDRCGDWWFVRKLAPAVSFDGAFDDCGTRESTATSAGSATVSKSLSAASNSSRRADDSAGTSDSASAPSSRFSTSSMAMVESCDAATGSSDASASSSSSGWSMLDSRNRSVARFRPASAPKLRPQPCEVQATARTLTARQMAWMSSPTDHEWGPDSSGSRRSLVSIHGCVARRASNLANSWMRGGANATPCSHSGSPPSRRNSVSPRRRKPRCRVCAPTSRTTYARTSKGSGPGSRSSTSKEA